jgi:hypothetical protein
MGMTAVALLIGALSIAGLGLVHHLGILALRRATPRADRAPHVSVLLAFQGLIVLHLFEILCFALLYWAVLGIPGIGVLGGSWSGTAADHIFLSGTVFTTLGLTNIKVEGPLRLIIFCQALGGFMVLTWSATFLYSLWSRPWD